MNDADFQVALAQLEEMRANKENMSEAQVTDWIKTHPEIVAECCDCSVSDVNNAPQNYIKMMIYEG